MDTIIVACKTIEDEVSIAKSDLGCSFPVEYIESGLHDRPKKLARTVQELLDDLKADRVLLCLGQCGNSMIGIKAADFELIMPKVDDCLSLLLGSSRKKSQISITDKAFFMTSGWLKGESTIMSEYQRSLRRYGKETAQSVIEMMYGHYKTMGLIDTGIDEMSKLYEKTEPMAKMLKLEQKTYEGSIDYIKQLLTGPWDPEHFIVKQPFEKVLSDDFLNML
ncbi:MAG: DUF1638 domain-containing protein [Firmicutes bacterium]|nr:DUF1638 domain-containing protein [Bacillota bacterium]